MKFKFIAALVLTIPMLSFNNTSYAATLEVKQNDVVLTDTDGIKSTDGAYVTIPPGGIIMWSGSIATIPAGWHYVTVPMERLILQIDLSFMLMRTQEGHEM